MKATFIMVFAMAMTALPAAAVADTAPFVSGRPGKAESPVTTPKGMLQVETEIASVTRDRAAGVTVDDDSALATSFRYGLADRVEAEVIVAPFLGERDSAGGGRAEGAGDVTLRLRFAAPGQTGGKLALGAIPFVTLPTGARAFSARRVEAGLALPAAYALDDKTGLSLTLAGVTTRKQDGTGRTAYVSVVAGVSRQITERLGAYGEVFTGRSVERKSRPESTADFGVTWLAAPTLQLDASVNLALTDAAPDRAFSIGVAHRF